MPKCIRQAVLPRFSDKKGWHGGSKNTLFAFTDQRTGHMVVRPVYDVKGWRPAADVRLATRAEAEKHWQSPLHSGWKVKC